MNDDIDLGKLSEREILILVANNQRTDRERINDHGKRIRVLEGITKTATGAFAIIGMAVGWFKIRARIE